MDALDVGEAAVVQGQVARHLHRPAAPRPTRAIAHPDPVTTAAHDPIEVIDHVEIIDVSDAHLAWEIWNNTFFTTVGRATHTVAAAVLLVVASPLLLLLALAIKLTSPGPALYSQQRYGLGGRQFACLKFRTMVVDADERLERLLASDPLARQEWFEHCKLTVDPRITRLGNFMRKTSLDELPQLINVVLGDMNLVGPRPLAREHELEWFGPAKSLLLSVRPGMTGLWQVSGRSETTRKERVELDLDYTMRRSPGLDLWILWRTVAVLLRPSKSGAR